MSSQNEQSPPFWNYCKSELGSDYVQEEAAGTLMMIKQEADTAKDESHDSNDHLCSEGQDSITATCLLCNTPRAESTSYSLLKLDKFKFLKHKLLDEVPQTKIDELNFRVQGGFPFCKICSRKIDCLQKLYNQLISIEKEFQKLKNEFVQQFLEASQTQRHENVRTVDINNTNTPENSLQDEVDLSGNDLVSSEGIECSPCSPCYVRLIRSKSLDKLCTTSTSKNDGTTYACEICPRTFVKLFSLKAHQQLHALHGATPFKCDTCPKSFHTSRQLRRHKWTHMEVKRYSCDICAKGFSRGFEVRGHKARVHHIVEKPIHCELCPGLKFYQSIHLKKHQESKHGSQLQDIVDICTRESEDPEDVLSTDFLEFLSDGTSNEIVNATIGGLDPAQFPTSSSQLGIANTSDLTRQLDSRQSSTYLDENLEAETYACGICPRKFVKLYYLEAHKKLHATHGPRPYHCNICDKKFYTACNLRRHKLIHTNIRKHVCEICDKKYLRASDYRNHKATVHHLIEKPLFCELCPSVKFFNSTQLTQHKEKCHVPNFQEVTKSVSGKKKAKKKKNGSSGNKTCNECGTLVPKGKLLRNHYLKEHPTLEIPKNYQCELCGQSYATTKSLSIHINTAHKGIFRFECPECSKKYPTRLSLDKHVASHGGRKILDCKYCEESFNHQLALRKHFVRAHAAQYLAEKSFACSACFVNFGSRDELVKHELEMHFRCKFEGCGKLFNNFGSISRHELIHTTIRPFKCDECGRSFNVKGNLTQHMKCHTGEKPFLCPQCGQGFLRRKVLEAHIKRMHPAATEDRPTFANY